MGGGRLGTNSKIKVSAKKSSPPLPPPIPQLCFRVETEDDLFFPTLLAGRQSPCRVSGLWGERWGGGVGVGGRDSVSPASPPCLCMVPSLLGVWRGPGLHGGALFWRGGVGKGSPVEGALASHGPRCCSYSPCRGPDAPGLGVEGTRQVGVWMLGAAPMPGRGIEGALIPPVCTAWVAMWGRLPPRGAGWSRKAHALKSQPTHCCVE